MILIPRYLITLALLLITACLALSGLTLWLTERRLAGMEARMERPTIINKHYAAGSGPVEQVFPGVRTLEAELVPDKEKKR